MEVSGYINKWLTILREMKNDNTYKIAWGRSIIEICTEINLSNYDNNEITIEFARIGQKMLKYYWNQIFYFNLKQSSDNVLNKKPKMVQFTEALINKYKQVFITTKPEWFNKVFPSNDFELSLMYEKLINKEIVDTLKQDVSHRFLTVKDTQDIGVYKYIKGTDFIIINKDQVKQIKDFNEVLTQLFNYKWALLLEKYNYSPKICNKVTGSGIENIKRNSLESFKKLLLLQYGENNIRDFYTNEIIPISEVSVDHVIPWSFIYGDDLWNLVITSKSFNSKKSNNIIKDEYIRKLENRNKDLIEFLRNYDKNQYQKQINELNFAIENNTVAEIYNYFRA